MNSLLGLGFGLPVSSPQTSVSKDGGTEGIDKYSAFSATPQSSKSVQPTVYGTKVSDLSDAVQAVMLEMQETGSGSTSFADAMANIADQSKDATSGQASSNGVFSSNSVSSIDSLELDNPSKEDEFKKASEDALKPRGKDDEVNDEKTDFEQAKAAHQQEAEQIEASLTEADIQASVTGLDSRVSAQVMSSRRSVNAMTGSLAA